MAVVLPPGDLVASRSEDIDVTVATPSLIGFLSVSSGCCLVPVAGSFLMGGVVMAAVALRRRGTRLQKERDIREGRIFPVRITRDVRSNVSSPYNRENDPKGFDKRPGHDPYSRSPYNRTQTQKTEVNPYDPGRSLRGGPL